MTDEKLKIDFATFVMSLHTSALMHLGIIANPIDNKTSINLDLARQNIDILEMFHDKTKGNLSEDEKKIIDSSLYDLRMKYIEGTKKKN